MKSLSRERRAKNERDTEPTKAQIVVSGISCRLGLNLRNTSSLECSFLPTTLKSIRRLRVARQSVNLVSAQNNLIIFCTKTCLQAYAPKYEAKLLKDEVIFVSAFKKQGVNFKILHFNVLFSVHKFIFSKDEMKSYTKDKMKLLFSDKRYCTKSVRLSSSVPPSYYGYMYFHDQMKWENKRRIALLGVQVLKQIGVIFALS